MTKDLSNSALRLLISHNIFMLGRLLFTIFFNVFIWSETNSLVTIAWFNIVALVTHMIIFHTMARFVKRGYAHLVRYIGLIGLIGFFFWLFSLKDAAIDYLIPIAIFYAIFNATYWISYHVIRFDLTTFKNRANYVGSARAITTAVKLLAPVLGGFLIVQNFFGWGYGNIFALAGALYVLALYVGHVKLPVHEWTKFHFWQSAKLFWKDPDMKKVVLSFMFIDLGFRGALQKILVVLIFDVLQNEFHLGGWLSAFSLVAIVVSYAFGRYTPYKQYKNAITVAGSFLFLSILMLAGFPAFVTYIIFGFASEVLSTFLLIPQKVLSENLLHRMKDYNKHRVELLVFREWFAIGFGRLSSYVLLFFVLGLESTGLKITLVIMAIFVAISTYLLSSVNNDLDTIKE